MTLLSTKPGKVHSLAELNLPNYYLAQAAHNAIVDVLDENGLRLDYESSESLYDELIYLAKTSRVEVI